MATRSSSTVRASDASLLEWPRVTVRAQTEETSFDATRNGEDYFIFDSISQVISDQLYSWQPVLRDVRISTLGKPEHLHESGCILTSNGSGQTCLGRQPKRPRPS
jgi:hypothetical protein